MCIGRFGLVAGGLSRFEGIGEFKMTGKAIIRVKFLFDARFRIVLELFFPYFKSFV